MRSLPAVLLTLAALAAAALAAQPPGILPGEEIPHVIVAPPQLVLDGRAGILPGEEAPEKVLTLATADGETPDWGVTKTGAPKVWAITRGKGVKVAVLDTGCDLTHPDLAGAVVASRDFTSSRSGPSDVNGHGTHCGGVIGARADGQGVVGVAPECALLVAKVLADNGGGTDAWIAAGIDWSVQQGADVISMSLGASQPSDTIHAAVKRATAAGVIVVAAAGNSGPREGTVGYPGGFPECVCVAASDQQDGIAQFSSRGPAVFVSAPGVRIRSTYPGGRYAEMSGTSMATPHVAGAAALWVAANQTVPRAQRPAQFRAALLMACKDLLIPGRDTASGHGLMMVDQLVKGTPGQPPAPGVGLTITHDDLTPDARAKFDRAFPGGKFKLEFPAPAQPGLVEPVPPGPQPGEPNLNPGMMGGRR